MRSGRGGVGGEQGHLFQGRYRTEMIEDESHYWTVSRYIHLNPVRAGLVQRPEQWEWSSYPGYRDARRRKHGWRTTSCWRPGRAIKGVEMPAVPTSASSRRAWKIRRRRRFATPLAAGSWAPSDSWLDCEATPVRSRPILRSPRRDSSRVWTRNGSSQPWRISTAWTTRRCRGVTTPTLARAVAAWLCRRHTEASLRELAEWLGLSRADSVPNLTRRLEAQLKASPELSRDLTEIMRRANAPAAGVDRAKVPRKKLDAAKPARPRLS